jgi:hypothetical protein
MKRSLNDSAHGTLDGDDFCTRSLPLMSYSTSRGSSPSQEDADSPTWTRETLDRAKTTEELDREFEAMFASQNESWDPEIGSAPVVVHQNGIYEQNEGKSGQLPTEVTATYVNALLPGNALLPREGIDGVKAAVTKPSEARASSEENKAEPKAALVTVIQSLAKVRGNLHKIRARQAEAQRRSSIVVSA